MESDVLEEGVFFALQEPRFVANPYRLFRALRLEAPLYWDFVLGGWFLTRYADVRAALADPRLTTTSSPFDITQLPPKLQRDLAPFGRVMDKVVLYTDAIEHARLRLPLNRAFNPAAFEELRPKMESTADELLAKAEKHKSMDVVTDYARPIADCMMSELLALPEPDRADFIRDCDRIKEFTMARRVGKETVARARVAAASFQSIRGYVRALMSRKPQSSNSDMIGRSLATEANESPLSEDDILANCVLFLHTGALNMSASITNAVSSLLQHPKEFDRLRDGSVTITAAIEELLRYETPIQVSLRGVPDEIDFAGQTIGPKQLLVLLLGAANRDPEVFPDPDRLDLGRRPNHHLSFGAGPHGCVGNWMARFGLTIALRAILDRQTSLRLKSKTMKWELPAIWRTLRTLPVSITRRLPSSRRLQVRLTSAALSGINGASPALGRASSR